jgi:hypothetical protein
MANSKWNSFWLGLVIGLILPALFCVAYSYTISLNQFWSKDMFDMLRPVLGRMALLGTFANMALIFLLYELNLWQLAKGMTVAVIPYMAAGIILLG